MPPGRESGFGGATARDTTRVKPCKLWKPGELQATGTVSVTPNRRSACERHDPTGEPDAGDPHVRFGGQGVETDLWEPD